MAIQIEAKNSRLTETQIELISKTLCDGGVIIYPTDTIYGIGCDITNKDAINRVRSIKGRDADKPMSFVCADLLHIKNYAQLSTKSEKILEEFLPGAYTFVLLSSKQAPKEVITEQRTVGLRIPDHAVPLSIVNSLKQPLLSTSANFSGEDVLTNPNELQEYMGDKVDLIITDGEILAQPSSVISLINDEPTVLRIGKGDVTRMNNRNS